MRRRGGLFALSAVLCVSCTKSGGTTSDADAAFAPSASATSGASADLTTLEDARSAIDLPKDALATRDLSRKRRLARALSRIADDRSADMLLDALPVEDPETLTYVSYGLGFSCAGREEKHVRALAARFASLPGAGAQVAPAGAPFDVRTSFLRALAHCGGELAETTLRAVLAGPEIADRTRAAFALGDMASRRRTLAPDSVSALLAAAAGDQAHAPTMAAFYPLSRLKADTELPLVDAAKRALDVPGPDRIFAIRALSKGGPSAIPEILAVVKDGAKFRGEERAEAARALGLTGALGQNALAEAISSLLPAKDPFAASTLGGALFGILVNLLDGVKDDPPKALVAALNTVANYRPPGDPPGTLGRRLGTLRCKAAAALAKGSQDAEVLVQCDTKGTVAWETARLQALVKRPLVRERRAAWLELSNSSSVRVREEALQAIEQHAELSDAGRAALAMALASQKPGLTAVAAEVLFKRPERAFEVSAKERRAALDPRAPAPTPFESPEKELDPRVVKALTDALVFAWPEDAVETRTLLLDAAAALHLKAAVPVAKKNCVDPNVTVRKRAQAALRLLGEEATCTSMPTSGAKAALPALLAKDTRVVFRTDVGELGITLETAIAPLTATRILALVTGGFYKNIVVHRVVPGFVVQFGDPGGDGYGGAGSLLRCETSPAPFEPLSVGIALAGRDTGSSQLFVTLSRTPHLDGEYTLLGHADGDWASVAEGDIIQDARATE